MEKRSDLRRLGLVHEIKEHAKTLITVIDHWCIIDADYGALSFIYDEIKRLNEYRNSIKKEMENMKCEFN